MKALILLTFVFLLSACGKSGGSRTSSERHTNNLSLSVQEEKLMEELVSEHSINQIFLMKKILSVKGINKDTLSKLDAYLEIECSSTTNLCEINKRK